jgi:hypothetical protein
MHERPVVPADPPPVIAIDATDVAPHLGLDVDTFRGLMGDGRISVLCERGIRDDAGLYRATFYHHGTRVRLVVDAHGHVLQADTSRSQAAP